MIIDLPSFEKDFHHISRPCRIFCGHFIDGLGGPAAAGITLTIAGSRIISIEPDISPPSDIDLSGFTILPGLIDAHLHLSISGLPDPELRSHQLHAAYSDLEKMMAGHVKDLLKHGIVAVRDGGDHYGHGLRFKAEYGPSIPLKIRASGKGWYSKARYGRLIGKHPEAGESLAGAIARDREPVDQVKIVNSGLNSLSIFGKETPPQFDLAEMKAAVDAATEKGLKVMVHANGRGPVQISVEAGCASVEHGFFMGRENLERMADRGTVWVPTAGTMKAYADSLEPGCPEAVIARQNLDHQLEQMALARELGVKTALGTDAGSLGALHGSGLIEEWRLFAAAGYSTEAIVRAATAIPAALLGLEDMGGLYPGSSATFIAVPGGPDSLPDSLSRIGCLFIDGRAILPPYRPARG